MWLFTKKKILPTTDLGVKDCFYYDRYLCSKSSNMFTNISWKEFAVFIAAASFLYYAWLLFIFYAKDILRIFNKNKVAEAKLESENASEEIFGIVYRLQDEVKETIEEAAAKKYQKEEIIISLQMVLEKYSLAATPFQFAVNNFIERTCKNSCSINLDEQELKQLWLR